MRKLFIVALFFGIAAASGLALAKDELKISEFKLMTIAGEKFGTDPATKQKVSEGVVIESAGQTDLIYTGAALEKGAASDSLAKLLMKTALREIRPGVYEVRHTLAILFLSGRWGTKGNGESGDVETVFEVEKNKPAELEKLRADDKLTASQSTELTVKGLALFKKYGYSNLTPEFEQLFTVKISQFVWSVNQQLPEIINKLIQRLPEAQSSVAEKLKQKEIKGK